MKFRRFNQCKGLTIEGEVIALRPGAFLKVRTDSSADSFVTTEYHLISVAEGCALRILVEIYDTGETKHMYFPEVMEQEWQGNLKRLRSYCEAASPPAGRVAESGPLGY